MHRVFLFIAFFLIATFSLLGQNDGDSTVVLSLNDYFGIIKRNHPIVRQATLIDNQAEALMLQARGGFDPKLFGDLNQKSFDEKNYFTLIETGFKVPSWFGLEFKGSYNWASGIFLNPEETIPANGQASLGVELSVLRGFLIDQRRTDLKQAKLFQASSEVQQLQIVNDILFDANKAYWNWVFAYRAIQIAENAVELAVIRLDGVRIGFQGGDKPAIDTLESTIQVQQRKAQLNDARLSYRKAQLELSNFLWLPNGTPIEISSNVLPPEIADLNLDLIPFSQVQNWLTQLDALNPNLRFYLFKLEQLNIDRRLNVEQLKPELNVSYNFLGDGTDLNPPSGNGENEFSNLFTQNYKLGVQFSTPLFLRKARSKIEQTDIKILETEFDLKQKRQELSTKLLAYFQEQENLFNQIDLQAQMTENYQRLLNGENEKFRIGESSMFLVNSREQKLIEARLKLAKLQADFFKNEQALRWAAGVIR